jgi:sulfofructose kinase
MNKSWNCVGFGLCVFDNLVIVEKYPNLNQKTEAVNFSQQGGGPVATAMVTLGRLGVSEVGFIGKVGNDQEGEFVRKDLELEGVDTRYLKEVTGSRTAQAFVWVEKRSGKRSVVLHRENNLNFKIEEVNSDPLESTKCLLIDGRDTEASLFAAKEAQASGTKVIMDAGSLRPRIEDYFPLIDYFICSKDFINSFSGNKELEQAIIEIHQKGCKWVVVTLGEKGSIGYDGGNFYQQPSFSVNVVDTTGAGDVFHGAFIFGLLQCWNLSKILLFSNAVAALKCTKLGGRRGIPNFEQVKDFLDLNKVNYFKN